MKCKICQLEKTHPKAFQEINQSLKENKKMRVVMRTVNDYYGLNITPNNITRHKSHYLKQKSTQPIEIKPEELKKVAPKRKKTHKTEAFLSSSINTVSFPELDPKHRELVMQYRANGYKNKEKAALKAGFKNKKKVYEIMNMPEVKAALYELRAVDFINLRITGNQIISGIGKIAHHSEIKHLMYDENGELITNIREWPEELRLALNAVEQETITTTDKDGNESERKKYKFKFESSLGAFKELRKHFMEVDLYKLGEEKRLIHKRAIVILMKRQDEGLNLSETMRLFEIEGLPFPESLKLEIKDFDWELERRIRKAEEDAKKALLITSKCK